MEKLKECIRVKQLKKEGKINLPFYVGDAGFDVYSTQDIVLKPLERFAMPLGIAIEFPSDLVCQVNTKSGNSTKYGFDTIGNVIDSNYRGEIHAIIVNISNHDLEIKTGMKVAQLLFLKHSVLRIELVAELSETERKENKFGSSGEI